MLGDCVPEWSKEQSRKGLFSQANTSTSKGQCISIMPFQNAESQTHLSQDGWCLLSGNRKVFVHLFVFPHAAPNNISLTPPSHNLCFLVRMCLSLCIHHPFNAHFSCWKSFQARMQNDFKCKCLAQMKHFRMTAGSFVVAKTGRRDTSTSRQDTAEPCPGLRPLSSVCLTNVYCIEVSVSA